MVFQNKEFTENKIFQFLTPKDDLEGKEFTIYEIALKESLDEEDVKNIAITAPYGAGKTSVLNSFFKTHINEYPNKLTISLAFFNNDKTGNPQNSIEEEEDTLLKDNVIEKGILKQLTYMLENKKTPKSRFKAIEKYKISFNIPIIIISLLISILIIKSLQMSLNLPYILYHLPLTIVLYPIIHYVIKDIISFKNIKINNKLTDTSLEFDKKNDSIFDKYLDEIIYFFEISKTNIVIFEDLDRFNNINIFIKLREINNILNNNNRIKSNKKTNKITFIYAIRDDIFKSHLDRTKFFDFIIPIIPILDSFNSKVILDEKIKKLNNSSISKGIDEDFIKNISPHIKSMRILINILNEYLIYTKRLESNNKKKENNENNKNLFAFITYKNIYHKDFIKLQNNEGNLYKSMQQRKNISDNLLIDDMINKLQIDIYDYRNLFASTKNKILTKVDKEFIQKIKNSNIKDTEAINLKDELKNIADIIEYLKEDDFKKTSILNYSLVRTLAATKDKNSENKKKYLFEQLIKNKEILKNFIENYQKENDIEDFVKELIKQYQTSYKDLDDSLKKILTEDIIKYADINDITNFDDENNTLIKELINSNRNFNDLDAIKLLELELNNNKFKELNGVYKIDEAQLKSGYFYMTDKNNKVIYLSIRGKNLKNIPKLINNFKELLELDLSNNNIEDISKIENFDNLISLNLSKNNNNENDYKSWVTAHIKDSFKNLIEFNGELFPKSS